MARGSRPPGRARLRLLASGGIAGPAAFTAAWIAASLRQPARSFNRIQLSGLAAPDAKDPWIMIAGFVVLGAGMSALGAALKQALGGPRRAGKGPGLVQVAGLATIAAGLFRRDQALLGPGWAEESWHHRLHDTVSVVVYAASLAAPLLLARRFRGDPRWAATRRPVLACALASAALLCLFASGAVRSWNGAVQRAMASVSLGTPLVLAWKLLTEEAVPETGDLSRADTA
jgi:hypothetical membrane protein